MTIKEAIGTIIPDDGDHVAIVDNPNWEGRGTGLIWCGNVHDIPEQYLSITGWYIAAGEYIVGIVLPEHAIPADYIIERCKDKLYTSLDSLEKDCNTILNWTVKAREAIDAVRTQEDYKCLRYAFRKNMPTQTDTLEMDSALFNVEFVRENVMKEMSNDRKEN